MSYSWILFASLLELYGTSLSSARKSCGSDTRVAYGFFYEYPWIAQVEFEQVKDPKVKEIACLGSLVNTRYVLTTATCAQGSRHYNLTGIKLGGYSTDNGDTIQVEIKNKIVHPDYNISDINVINDIALFELDRKIELTDTLHTVDLTVVGKKQCAAIYETAKKEIGDGVICVGGECRSRGDTGGPLIDLRTQSVVGVMSYGPFTCRKEGWPIVYTNVIKYLPWIKEIINQH